MPAQPIPLPPIKLFPFFLLAAALVGPPSVAAEPSATSTPTPGIGLTLYVSKLGENSDGRSWRTAYKTIQAALDLIPYDKGGHRIIIRPDSYAEANL